MMKIARKGSRKFPFSILIQPLKGHTLKARPKPNTKRSVILIVISVYRSSELDPCGALFRLQPRVKRIFKDILRGWLVSTGVDRYNTCALQIPGWDPRSTAFQLVYKPSALRSFLLSSPFSSPVIINRPCYRIRVDKASLIVKDRSIPWLS